MVVAEGESEFPVSPNVCAVVTALASGILLAIASSDDVAQIVLPTAAIGLVGLAFLLLSVSLWRRVDRDTATIERVTRPAERNLFRTAFEGGPAEATTQGLYSLFSTRGLLRFSAIVALISGLAIVALAVMVAINDGALPAAVRSGAKVYGVIVDVVELFGYALLTLVLLFVLLTADHETPVGFILVVLALYAVSIGLGLWLGAP